MRHAQAEGLFPSREADPVEDGSKACDNVQNERPKPLGNKVINGKEKRENQR